jgi:HEAT repeat protein
MLLGEINTNIENDRVPDYLAAKYDREGAAIELGESSSNDPKVIQALSKACISDEEEDVRKASLEALLKLNKKVAVETAQNLLNDTDEFVSDFAAHVINVGKSSK